MREVERELPVREGTVSVHQWDGTPITCEGLALALSTQGTHARIVNAACAYDCADAAFCVPIANLHTFINVHKHLGFILADVAGDFLAVHDLWQNEAKYPIRIH